MPDVDLDSLLRLAPSKEVSEFRLTVAEARALPRELFRRTFDRDGLDDMPVVARGLSGPGIFDEAPPGLEAYIWLRPAPDPKRRRPGEKASRKARKKAAFVFVTKIPKDRRAAAGGRDRIFRTLRATTVDEARLEVLQEDARKKRRVVRPATWPVERVVSLPASWVLEVFLVRNNLRERPGGKESGRRKKKTRQNIVRAAETFRREFADCLIGDLEGEWIADEYQKRAGCKPTTRYVDLKSVKKGLRGGLALLGIRDYKVEFDNPKPARKNKMPWTPEEHDAIMAATHGWKTLPDGTRIPSETGGYRGQWQRGIPFMVETATRHGILPNIRWLPPWIEPSDGLPLALCDRAWIEVTPGRIYFHRDGGMAYDSNKGRAGNVIPDEFAPVVRAWFEHDMSIGKEFVFRRKNGERYVGCHIGRWTFRRIIADSGVPWHRVPHHLKDFAKEVAEASGLRVESFGAHADTSVAMLEGTYGDATRAALLQEAAERHSLAAWREKMAGAADIVERFRRGREDAEAAKTRMEARGKRQGKGRAESRAQIPAEAAATLVPAGPVPSARPERRASAPAALPRPASHPVSPGAAIAGGRAAERRAGSRKPG